MSTQKTELIRTSQSWNGAELADYQLAAVGSAPGDGEVTKIIHSEYL
jgi:hypothetical protein